VKRDLTRNWKDTFLDGAIVFFVIAWCVFSLAIAIGATRWALGI
jgi:hypothetical protein